MMERREGEVREGRTKITVGVKVTAWNGHGQRGMRCGECECAGVGRNCREVRQEGNGMRRVYMEDRGRGEKWVGVKSTVSTFSLHWKLHESERSFFQEGIPTVKLPFSLSAIHNYFVSIPSLM